MAGSRKPGPLGLSGQVEDLDDGTLVRALSPPTGLIGLEPPSANTFSRPGSTTAIPPRVASRKSANVAAQILRQGKRGSEVQKIQRLLNLRLVPSPNLAIDGIFGTATLQAILQYQKGVSIAADGLVGKETWYHLLKGTNATFLQPPTRTPQPLTTRLGGPFPTTAPSRTASSNQVAAIWEWPLEDKFAEALRRTAPKLPGSMRHEFEALLSPTSLRIMAGTLVVWAGSHAFGVGETVDIVLLAGGAFFLGMAVFDVAGELGDFLVVTSTAVVAEDLNEAASHLARAIAIMGVAAFITLLAKVARGRGGSNGAAAEAAPSKLKSPAKPQPKATEPKPEIKPSVRFGKRGIYTEPGAQPPTKHVLKEIDECQQRRKLPAPERAGWPKILSDDAATFKAPPEPIELPEGSKIYRIMDSESNPNGSYWTSTDPRTMTEAQWRSGAAVKGNWNGDGAFVEYEVPKGGMKVWSGEAAPQISSDGVNVLAGGGNQIWIPPGSANASAPISTGWIK